MAQQFPRLNQQGNVVPKNVFIADEKMGIHVKLYEIDSPLLSVDQMRNDVLNAIKATQDNAESLIYYNAILSGFKDLTPNLEEQKRFIYLLAYPVMKYQSTMNAFSLYSLICVIYEMIRAEKSLCDDSLIYDNSKPYNDIFNYVWQQSLGYNRMDYYKKIIDDTALAIGNTYRTVDVIADYINKNFKVAYDTEESKQQEKPIFGKQTNIATYSYASIESFVNNSNYRKAIIDKLKKLPYSNLTVFRDLIKNTIRDCQTAETDTQTLSNLVCAIYEMIKDDSQLSGADKLEISDAKSKTNTYISRQKHYEDIIISTFNKFKSTQNAPIVNIVKYMSSNFKVANNCLTQINKDNKMMSVFEVDKPMNIRLYDMDSPMTAQEMIGDGLNRLSNSAYQVHATAIKSCFDSLKDKPKKQKIIAYLLLCT